MFVLRVFQARARCVEWPLLLEEIARLRFLSVDVYINTSVYFFSLLISSIAKCFSLTGVFDL